MADTSQTRLAYIAESVYGTTPATPTFKKVRYTGESLKHARQNITSNEIRPDRNVADLVQVAGGAEGGVNFELSYGTFDDFLESFMYSAWSSNVLKNGITPKSFSIEKTFETGATDNFFRYTGMIANTFNLDISTQQIVTGSFGFMGKGGSVATTAISGATYTDAPTYDVMNAGTNFASLAVTGVTSPKITALSLQGTNNLRQKPVVGSVESLGVGAGRFVLTGTVTMYFENKEAYDLFLAGTATDLTFTIGGASETNYEFVIPRLKFSDADVATPGNDQDVMITLPFQALYDPTEQCTLKITRVPETP
ncbi:phage tail tube protein [Micavibrio aeruginosavorus]|uniref:Phage tail protein n=1 Tax=Micavibrio aeruginosavorus (strain ARL-13) TaxID=856793 RepID=G2KLQ8_MICAA|nr:phage tail tube protein [Micavibrio aeruginosavorus]AEP08888.1 putative uncharacterized protein [Micavibrio aeruginosavorus ARL-13]